MSLMSFVTPFPLAPLAADYKLKPYAVLYAADAAALTTVRAAMRPFVRTG